MRPIVESALNILLVAGLGWEPTGLPVSIGRTSGPRAASDASGGVFVVWRDENHFDSNYADVYGQHVLASGTVHSSWPASGAAIASESAPFDELPSAVATGGNSSAFWLWGQRLNGLERDYMLKRTIENGALDPAWPLGGVDVVASTMEATLSSMCPDGSGGVLIAWTEEAFGAPSVSVQSARVQRILANGTVAPGWPVGGVQVANELGVMLAPVVLADGAGGAFVKFDQVHWDTELEFTMVQHLLADGSIAPGWPAGGMRACTVNSFQTSVDQSLIPDGAGGVYVAWDDMRDMPPGTTTLQGEIFMARIAADGTRPTGWPETGRPVHVAPGAQWFPRLCQDGAGGVLAVWTDNVIGQAKLTRITSAGAQAPGWPAGGTVICTAAGYPDHPHLAPDGTGGAFAAWSQGPSERAYAQHFRGDGTLAPGWAMTGTLLVDIQASLQRVITIHPAELGKAIVVWQDSRQADTPRGSIRAQKLVTDGLVPVQLALQSALADARSVRLAWWGVGVSEAAFVVERSRDGEAWAPLGAASIEGTERLTYEDRDVHPGDHLAYRLVDGSGRVVVAAAWVQVPQALEFALAGARPNPARLGALTVELSLAKQATGTLELLDLAGRRLAWRELGSLAAGRHTLPFPETASLAPGMHWLRLRQGVRESSTRVVLTR